MPTGRERSRSVEYADIVKPKETALKNVHALVVFAIHPPREVEKKLVKRAFQKIAVGYAADAFFDLVDAPHGPRMDGRIDISERPFIRRKLPVGVHVPFPQKKRELLFCKVGIDL